MRHLSRMGTYSTVTNMHCKNIAIVWAPNLLRWLPSLSFLHEAIISVNKSYIHSLLLLKCGRSKQIESACFSGTSAFMEVRVQSVVVEFILNHVDVLFSPKLSTLIRQSTGEK